MTRSFVKSSRDAPRHLLRLVADRLDQTDPLSLHNTVHVRVSRNSPEPEDPIEYLSSDEP